MDGTGGGRAWLGWMDPVGYMLPPPLDMTWLIPPDDKQSTWSSSKLTEKDYSQCFILIFFNYRNPNLQQKSL